MFVLSLFLFLFYLSVFKFQFMEKNWTSPFAWCSALQLIRLKFPAQSMFSFLHRPSVLLHKTSIYCQEQRVLIFCCIYILFGLSCVGSHWLALYWITENHGFSLKKVYGTRVNKLTVNVNFLGKYYNIQVRLQTNFNSCLCIYRFIWEVTMWTSYWSTILSFFFWDKV